MNMEFTKIRSTLTAFFLFCVPLIVESGCSQKPCREAHPNALIQPSPTPAPMAESDRDATDGEGDSKEKLINGGIVMAAEKKPGEKMPSRVWIYKYDGSKQCGTGEKISLSTMEKDLKGIKVFKRKSENDGKMRIQMCGTPTGTANVYEIKYSDLEKAQSLGFNLWPPK